MSKAIALAAFNTAVVVTNIAHAAKRGAVKAASQSKEASISFWAGMKYAHQQNKANAAAAERLTAEDIEASQPKATKTSTVSKAKATKTRAVSKAKAAAAERLTAEDIEASQPKATKTRTVSKAKAAARSSK